MEPFSITCTTCQAKLKVRSAAAIGQILSCPKCESMVQVLAPPGWQADVPATASPATSSPATPQPPHGVAEGTSAAPPNTSSLADVAASFEDLTHFTAGHSPPTAPPVELPPLSANWTSPTETLWRKVALYSVAGGTVAILLGLGISFMLSGEEAPIEGQSAVIAAADTPAPGEDPSQNNPATPSPAPDEAAEPAAPPKAAVESLLPSANDNAAAPLPLSDPAKSPVSDTTATPAKTPIADPVPTVPSPEKSVTEKSVAETPTPDQPSAEAPLDAAKLLADASLESLLPGEAPSPDAALTVPAKEMTEAELAAAADAEAESAANSDGAGGTIDDIGPQSLVRRVPADSSHPLPPAEEILRLQLPQITFNTIPLAQFLSELSDLSTLPVTFDLNALSAAQISPDVRVSIAASDKTLAEILAATLASKRLTYITDGRHVIVTTPAAIAAARDVKFTVEDLAADQDRLRELAALIVKTVAPESWQYADGPGKIELEANRLALEQSGSVIHESIIFCERLRVARGLATRSRLPADQLSLEVAQLRAKAHLARKVACTFHAPTRLTDVVRYLEEISGAKIFIDWRSLAEADISPQDMLTCALPEQPLSEALDTLLSPLGLSYRVLDADTLEVFAQQDLPSKMTREFYPLGSLLASGVTVEVLLNGVRQLTGEAAWEPATTGFLHFDPASQHLIVRHGNKVHAQVQRLLDELTRKLASKKMSGGKG